MIGGMVATNAERDFYGTPIVDSGRATLREPRQQWHTNDARGRISTGVIFWCRNDFVESQVLVAR
jgi:hypothetical protein